MKKEITYSPHIQKEFETAIVFLIQKIKEHCYNEKPLILHSIRVGLKLMEQKEAKEVVIAGFLHDLIEDTDCKLEEIKNEFGEKVAMLVAVCTFDRNIKDYKERWRNLISNLKRAGKDALIIKLIDQMENLPYYMLISDEEKKKEVMWKYKFFISECRSDLEKLPPFKDYENMVENYETK
ncbi:bifunctional (p)ppGpp synthetase/guanosine-3',5'-bis(diphosphate) 3'-pyrophosphohydrolase [Candidatus Azambacteria bacterium]|nr:bifunctional (p)ppGpp synthetase/guanosine-3',5'-bis(diphosphate) 3'-pyrophosphohydrolase [Candidatus Azambacteria bacterium]